MTIRTNSYDCVVLGGGPAGATAAALLAEAGPSVLLVERETTTRDRVGESLMPESYWTFQKLGLLDRLAECRFAKKVGVQFVSHDGRESQPFFFRSRYDHPSSETWHVERGRFDQLLLDNARAKGAVCLFGTRASEVLFEADQAVGVRLQGPDGESTEIASRVVIDATGQQSLLAHQLRLKQPNPQLRKAALWRHFRGGERDTSGGGVKTTILHTQDQRAWFWYIPQSNNIVSVGCVGDADHLLKGRGTVEEVFAQERAQCEGIERRLATATPTDPLAVAREFSYSTDLAAGPGWLLVGDAWGFIDPVYSSGVFFAMKSAEMASDGVIEALQENDLSSERLGVWLPEFVDGTRWVRKLVDAFYSGQFRVGRFVKEYPEHAGPLTDLLVGKMFSHNLPALFADLDPWLERQKRGEEKRA